MKYKIYSRVDESGAVTASMEGLLRGEADDLQEAEKMADIPGGYIKRAADGAVQAPDGTWISGQK
jgi:hypothetical protein